MTVGSPNTIACPHCRALNPVGSAFCESCGKALPTGATAGPRIIAGNQFATTAAGQKLQSDELEKQAKKAAGALLAVAVVQTAFGALVYFLLQNAGPQAAAAAQSTVVVVFGVAVIFWGLYFWARKAPFPAAIVGLVVYVTLWLLDLIVWAVAISNHPGAAGTGAAAAGPFNGIIIKIIIIAVLINAIKAGAKHRQLLRQQSSGLG
jgi:hypothetical protein